MPAADLQAVALGVAAPSGSAFAIPDDSLEAALRALRESAQVLEARRRDAARDARFRWALLVALSQLQLHVRAVYRAVSDLGRIFAAYPQIYNRAAAVAPGASSLAEHLHLPDPPPPPSPDSPTVVEGEFVFSSEEEELVFQLRCDPSLNP